VPTDGEAVEKKKSGKLKKKKTHEAEEADIDAETRKQLEALGYFEE
jgi:hypothetical protein